MRNAVLRRDEHGAVFVEKLIVYLPLLAVFFATWELSELAAASLVVQRASAAAGRAAVVVLPDDPAFYEGEATHRYEGRRREDVQLAAGMILSALPRIADDFAVDVSDVPSGVGTVDVTVAATYECGVGFFCGDGAVQLSATTSHAYQGALYEYTMPGDAVGGSTAGLVGPGKLRKRGGSSAQVELGSTSQAVGSKGNARGKSCSCSYVYRRDSRPPSVIFGAGFDAKGSNMDLGQHVEGSGQGGASGYVSTTKSERVAFKLFWQANELTFKDDWIYKIRDCGKGVDVNNTLDSCTLPPEIGKKVDAYAYQQEVAIPGRINPEDIVSAIKPRKGDKPRSITPTADMTEEERAAYLDWPPLDEVKVKGKTQKNPGYDRQDAKRQSSCTVM